MSETTIVPESSHRNFLALAFNHYTDINHSIGIKVPASTITPVLVITHRMIRIEAIANGATKVV